MQGITKASILVLFSRRRILWGVAIVGIFCLAIFGYYKIFRHADYVPVITGALAKALTASTATIEACPPAGIPGMPSCSGNASSITQPIITNINDQLANAADVCISDYLNTLNQNNKDGSIPIDIPEDGTKAISATTSSIPNTTCTSTVSRNGILPGLDSLNVIKPLSVSLKISQTLVADTTPVALGYLTSSTKNEVIETTPMSGSVSVEAQTYLLYNKDAKTGERFWTRGLKPFATALTDRYSLSNSKGIFNGSYKIQINSRDDVFDQKLATHKLDDFLKVNGLNADTVVFDQKVSGVDDTFLNAGITNGTYADGDTAREHQTFWYESSAGTFDGGIGFSWGPDTSGASKTTLSSLSFCPNGCTLTNVEERNIRAKKSAVVTVTPQTKYPDDYLATECAQGAGKCSYAALFSWMKHTEAYSGKGVVDLATGTIRWDKEFKVINTDESKDRHGMQAMTKNSILRANTGVIPLPDMKNPRAWAAGGLTDYEYTFPSADIEDFILDDYQYLATNNIQTTLYPFKDNLSNQTVTSASKLEHNITDTGTTNYGNKRNWKKINDSSYSYTKSGSGPKPLYNKIPTVTTSKYSKSITDSSSGCGAGTSQSWTGHFVAGTMSAPVVDTYQKCASSIASKPPIPAIIDSTITSFMGNSHINPASWLTPIHFEYLDSWYDKNGNLVADSGYGYGADGIVQANTLQMDGDSDGVADCITPPVAGATIVGGNYLFDTNGTIKRCPGTTPLREHTFLTMPNTDKPVVTLSTLPIKVLPSTVTMVSAWDTTNTAVNAIYTPYANAMKNLMAEIKQLNPKATTSSVSTLYASSLMSSVSTYKNGWLSVLAPSFDEGLIVGKYTATNPSLMSGLINAKVSAVGSNYFPISQNSCNSQPTLPMREVLLSNSGVFKSTFGINASTAIKSAYESNLKSSGGKAVALCPSRDLLYFNKENIYQPDEQIEPSYMTLAGDSKSIIYFSRPDAAFYNLPVNLESDQLPDNLGQMMGAPFAFPDGTTLMDVKYSPDKTKAYIITEDPDSKTVITYFEFSTKRIVTLTNTYRDISWISNTSAVAISYESEVRLVKFNADGSGKTNLKTFEKPYDQIAVSGNTIALWAQKNETTGVLDLKTLTGSDYGGVELPFSSSVYILPSPTAGNFLVEIFNDDGTVLFRLVKGRGEAQELNLNILGDNISWLNDSTGLMYIHQTDQNSPFVFSKFILSSKSMSDIKSYEPNARCSEVIDLITINDNIFFNCSSNIVGFRK